jgi:hypothetical protein
MIFFKQKLRKILSSKDEESELFKVLQHELSELHRSSGIVRVMNLSAFH